MESDAATRTQGCSRSASVTWNTNPDSDCTQEPRSSTSCPTQSAIVGRVGCPDGGCMASTGSQGSTSMRAPSSVRKKKRSRGRLPSTSSTPPSSKGVPEADGRTVAVGSQDGREGFADAVEADVGGGVAPSGPHADVATQETIRTAMIDRTGLRSLFIGSPPSRMPIPLDSSASRPHQMGRARPSPRGRVGNPVTAQRGVRRVV